MSESKFCITMNKESDKIAKIVVEVNASSNDLANMFHSLYEHYEEVIPSILAGIFYDESENKTLN